MENKNALEFNLIEKCNVTKIYILPLLVIELFNLKDILAAILLFSGSDRSESMVDHFI